LGARFIEGLLKNTTKTIENEGFVNRSKVTSTAFTRNRKLTFKNLLLTLMSLTRPGVQCELDRFFKSISECPESFNAISKSAFTQSRRNLKPESFLELSSLQLDYFSRYAPYKKSWHGARVVAIDGSFLNLPNSEEIKYHFGSVKNQYDETIRAKCSFAFDVCNELIIDAQIDRHDSNEQELAARHLSVLNPKTDILVFDRGYPSQWLIGLLIKHGFKFCIRLSSRWESAYNSLAGTAGDIDWKMIYKGSSGLKKLKELGVPKEIEGLRLISIKLPSGEKEVLVTNLLDRKEFKINDFKELYHLRWGVEEAFKLFKKVLYIEYFTGKTVIAVKQEFYAKAFMQNMSSIIRTQGFQIKKSKTTKHEYQISKTQAIAKTKDFLISFFVTDNIRQAISKILELISCRIEIVRRNRSFPRPDSAARRKFKSLNSRGI
jgi:hypothetical protein